MWDGMFPDTIFEMDALKREGEGEVEWDGMEILWLMRD